MLDWRSVCFDAVGLDCQWTSHDALGSSLLLSLCFYIPLISTWLRPSFTLCADVSNLWICGCRPPAAPTPAATISLISISLLVIMIIIGFITGLVIAAVLLPVLSCLFFYYYYCSPFYYSNKSKAMSSALVKVSSC